MRTKYAPCQIRRLLVFGLLALMLYCIIQAISGTGFSNTDFSNEDKLSRMSQLIQNFKDQMWDLGDGNAACKLPELDINNPDIMKFIHDVPPLRCSPDDWVKVKGSKLYIDEKPKNQFGKVTCAFNEIIREGDFKYSLTKTVESNDHYILKFSDYAEVKCESQSGKQWHSILAGVKDDPVIKKQTSWDKVPEKALKLNVLMFGFDSLSKNTFVRKLPKSYRYMKQTLKSLVLDGYNIIGDGTPQALIPILTGKIELELPETRKRMGTKANFVNVYPFIWNNYKASGYITSFMEDVHQIGTFTYRLKGFDQQPTDHYMRTYYLAASPLFRYSKKFCMVGTPRHSVMMNHIKTIFDEYKNQPKFTFGFHGELSHDSYNDIGAADDDLLQWLKDLQDAGHLNNTVLILMSDHGHRFAEIRNTVQGKQEERLPFFSFTFPPWFKQKYPQAYANFVYNTQLLTTPFDVHKTLEHILDFENFKDGDRNERAISLFDKIPLQRTCADAFIEPHWCACLVWEEISVSDAVVLKAADYFVKSLNSYTADNRNICEELKLGKVAWAAKFIPTKGLLKFQNSADKDGYLPDLTGNTKLSEEIYQLKIQTEPGGGLYEASITYNVLKDVFYLKISDVSRINKYGSQARCVENNLYHLRKYCYCK